MSKWFCYILKNNTGKSYNGSTNNIIRRLRQHNGELVGGAKFTKRYRQDKWQIYFLMTGFVDHSNCLQAEWKIKYPNNKRPRPKIYNDYDGRIKGVNEILKLQNWTSNSVIDNTEIKYEIWIVKEYAHLLFDYPNNFIVHNVDIIDYDLLQQL